MPFFEEALADLKTQTEYNNFLDDAQELARVLGVLPECHGEIIVRDLIWESASPGLHGEGVLERGLRGDDHWLHLDVEVLPAAHTHRR